MKKILIKDLYTNTSEYAGEEVSIDGWVRTVRDSKTFGFIELNDGTFFIQNNLLKFKQIL